MKDDDPDRDDAGRILGWALGLVLALAPIAYAAILWWWLS